MGVDVKQAIQIAADYLKLLFGDVGGMRLEEVERKSNDLAWLVTLSFIPQYGDKDFAFLNKREYKQIEVNDSGEPVALRIRHFE